MPWYGYALLTALSIALVGVLQKKTLQNEHSAEYFMVFSLLKVGLFFLFARSINWTVTDKQFGLLVLTGLLAGLAFYFVTKALRRLDLSVVAPVLALDSGLGSLIALVLLRETLSGSQLFGLALLLVGTYVLELRHQPPGWWRDATHHLGRLLDPFRQLWGSPGGIFALLSMSCFALSGVVDRAILRHLSATTYLAYVLPTIAAVSLVVFGLTKTKLTILRVGSRTLFWSIILTAGLHLVSNITQAKATALIAVGLVLALKRLSSLIDVLLSGRLFHEHGMPQKILASLIILVGVFFVVIR